MSATPSFAEITTRLAARNVPLHALFEITERCNYACTHCYLPHRDDAELSTEEALRVIDQLADAGTMFLTITGGEIFLRRDVWEIAERARDRELVTRFFTNGYLVDEEKADRLAALNPIGVEISLYAPDAEGFERVTQVPGSFARTTRAIRLLAERGLRVVAKTPVMTVNARRLAETRALALALGADFQFDVVVSPMDGGEPAPFALRPGTGELEAALRFAKSITPASDVPPTGKPLDSAPCNAGRASVAISPRGEVYPCVAIKVPAGSLREKSLSEIWYGDASILAQLRGITVASLSVCSTCEDRPWCPRCAGVARHEDGGLDLPSREACRIAAARRAVDEGRPIPAEPPPRGPKTHHALPILS